MMYHRIENFFNWIEEISEKNNNYSMEKRYNISFKGNSEYRRDIDILEIRLKEIIEDELEDLDFNYEIETYEDFQIL